MAKSIRCKDISIELAKKKEEIKKLRTRINGLLSTQEVIKNHHSAYVEAGFEELELRAKEIEYKDSLIKEAAGLMLPGNDHEYMKPQTECERCQRDLKVQEWLRKVIQ